MRLLLDTQTWLWVQSAPRRLSADATRLLVDPANELLLSAASSWEIAIKYELGKLPLPIPPADYVPDRLRRSGVAPLPVHHSHALHVASLPLHHRDPFDRLMIAQAQLEDLHVVTSDHVFSHYDVTVHWAS